MTITIHGLFTINTYLPTTIIAMTSFYKFDYERAKDFVLGNLLCKEDPYKRMYVEAWKGIGATALLREVAEEVKSKKKKSIFDTVIKVVRPAPFQNSWEILRVVAKQLNLPPSVTDILDAADEENEFGLRSNNLSVIIEEIKRAVRDRIVLLVFCNNSADDPYKLTDPDNFVTYILGRWIRNVALWTTGMNISYEAEAKAEAESAFADWSLMLDWRLQIEPSNKAEALDLVYKEAAEIARYIEESSGGSLHTTPQLVLRCFWYCMLLCTAFNRSQLLDDDRPSEAVVKYFVCEGILQGDAAWEIGRALSPVIGPIIKYQLQYWQEAFSAWTPPRRVKKELLPLKTLIIGDKLSLEAEEEEKEPSSEEEEKEPSSEEPRSEEPSPEEESYHWISVRSPQNNNPEPWDFFKIYGSSDMSKVSSFFGHFEKTHEVDLPDDFFDHFSNIRVLDLLGCIVCPINSSFLRLRNLRMLRLDQCSVVDPSSLSSAQEEKRQQQAILFDSLWVLNLYNSDADTFLLAGKAFELMPNLRVLHLTEHINTEFLPRNLSMAINLKELILTNCKGLQYLNFNLPATIETIRLQSCPSLEEVELVDRTAAPLPNLKTFHLSDSKLIAKLSLRGCRKLENVHLQELTELEVLNLSCTAIKVVDIFRLPQLKQIFLLGCVLLHRVVGLDKGPKLDVLYLDNYNSSSACGVDHCLDSFRNQSLSDLTKGTNDADQRLFRAHVVVRDVRLFRSLREAFPNLSEVKTFFHIHIKGSSTIDQRGFNIGTTTESNDTITSALCYADVLNTMTDRQRLHHQSPPTTPLNNHIEVDGCDNSRIVEEEDFRYIMEFANSLFVHNSTFNFTMDFDFTCLECLCIERCPDLEFFFHSWKKDFSLESIWLSQLPRLKALCNGSIESMQLKHIYLEFCTRLESVLPPGSRLRNLETINIRYCNDLTTIFYGDYDDDKIKDKSGVAFEQLPNLKSIHLQELPKLQHIYKPNICAPSLEELKIRGCFNLGKLPLFGTSDARSIKAVKISCEKDWWDNLQWNASLFNPIHCRYYKKPMKARWL